MYVEKLTCCIKYCECQKYYFKLTVVAVNGAGEQCGFNYLLILRITYFFFDCLFTFLILFIRKRLIDWYFAVQVVGYKLVNPKRKIPDRNNQYFSENYTNFQFFVSVKWVIFF